MEGAWTESGERIPDYVGLEHHPNHVWRYTQIENTGFQAEVIDQENRVIAKIEFKKLSAE